MIVEKRTFWKYIESLIVQEYEEIKEMSMRDSYYHISDILAEGIGKKIDRKLYNYFWVDKTYFYYTQDKWSTWEKRYNIKRPQTKNYTILIERGKVKLLPENVSEIWERARGYIFVEKEGKAEDLSKLSEYGWLIIGSQGHSQRRMREILKNTTDEKPILIFHDADKAGEIIRDTFIKGSKRTTHLDLIFKKVVDLGLSLEDAKKLDLQLSPDPKGGLRCEINSLIRLKKRNNIKNPFLWYVVNKMIEKNIPLCPEPQSFKDALFWRLRSLLIDTIEHIAEDVAQRYVDGVDDQEIMEIEREYRGTVIIENDEVRKEFEKLTKSLAKEMKPLFQIDIEQKIIRKANEEIKITS